MITETIGSYFLLVQGIRGARVGDSDAVLRELRGAFQGVDLQLFRADRVAGREHLVFAAKNAVDSFIGNDRRAKHLSMELLLFASGEHQIVEAIKLLGLAASSTEVALVAFSETKFDPDMLSSKVAEMMKGVPDDTVLDIETPPKVQALKKAYKITDREMKSSRMPGESENSVLKRLVIERSALLVLQN